MSNCNKITACLFVRYFCHLNLALLIYTYYIRDFRACKHEQVRESYLENLLMRRERSVSFLKPISSLPPLAVRRILTGAPKLWLSFSVAGVVVSKRSRTLAVVLTPFL